MQDNCNSSFVYASPLNHYNCHMKYIMKVKLRESGFTHGHKFKCQSHVVPLQFLISSPERAWFLSSECKAEDFHKAV